MVPSPEERMAAESFYRDANTLLYADNKPTEDAIDRVVGKINREYVIMLRVFPQH
jgi:pre-mRNA-splicing factor SYF2